METTSTEAVCAAKQAIRINHSLTARVEKRLLVWLAERMPQWVSSDQLTALGLIAQMSAGLCYALARCTHWALLGAILCIVLNWLGDSLDGTLARVRNQQRPRYGFYVDHLVDVLGATAMMAGLACSGFLHWTTAAAMLVAFLLLASESYLAACTLAEFQLSQGCFGPTEIRLLLIAGNLALLHSPYAAVFGHRMLLFDLGGLIATAGMAVLLLRTAARHTVALYRQEPLA